MNASTITAAQALQEAKRQLEISHANAQLARTCLAKAIEERAPHVETLKINAQHAFEAFEADKERARAALAAFRLEYITA